jgi:hypothetical protein
MTEHGEETERKQVRLYEHRGETSRYVDAEIAEDGSLVLFCQDVGKAPKEWWGDADYEFWVTVSPEHKDDVLLALIERQYGGNPRAVDDFRGFLASQGIPSRFETWT